MTRSATKPPPPTSVAPGEAPLSKAVAPGEAPTAEYTWQQVAEHGSAHSCWVIYQGGVYDVTAFLPTHPGGVDMVVLAAGRDVTNLLPSYHWWTDAPEAILRKYRIGTLAGAPEFPEFPPDTGFYRDCRRAAADYFRSTGRDPKDPTPGLVRLAFMALAAALSFAGMYGATGVPFGARVLAALVFGVCQALPLLHVMHDASHTAISHSHQVWAVVSHLTMDLFAGASIYSWLHQHVLSHHLYTNIVEVDSDMPMQKSGDLRRVATGQLWAYVYKFQVVYLPILYSLLGMKFRIQDISGTLMERKNGATRVGYISPFHIVEQIFVKCFFLWWRIVAPIQFMGNSVVNTAVLFLIAELTTGIYLSYNFQVSHISPSAAFPDPGGKQDEWAISQVITCVDYAHGDPIVTFLSGALNYQVIHHLFPSISQYHYPGLAPRIIALCAKYDLPYTILPSFTSAFGQHLRHLYEMGWNMDYTNQKLH